MKTYSIKIEKGCYQDSINAPDQPGIVFVYLLKKADNKYNYHALLEIISTNDILNFLTLNVDDWGEEITDETKIYFSWSVVSHNSRTRILAGLTNFCRPIMNESFLDYFPFGPTEIVCDGNLMFLQKKICIGE